MQVLNVEMMFDNSVLALQDPPFWNCLVCHILSVKDKQLLLVLHTILDYIKALFMIILIKLSFAYCIVINTFLARILNGVLTIITLVVSRSVHRYFTGY